MREMKAMTTSPRLSIQTVKIESWFKLVKSINVGCGSYVESTSLAHDPSFHAHSMVLAHSHCLRVPYNFPVNLRGGSRVVNGCCSRSASEYPPVFSTKTQDLDPRQRTFGLCNLELVLRNNLPYGSVGTGDSS